MNMMLSQLKQTAMDYTSAVMTASNPALRDMFKRMLDHTFQHHEILQRIDEVHGVYGSEQAVRLEDVRQRIAFMQQAGNDLHAYVHHHLRYDPVHTGTGHPAGGNGEHVGRSQGHVDDLNNPSQSTGMLPGMNSLDVNQIQAHQPSTFGFNQEFGHQEGPSNVMNVTDNSQSDHNRGWERARQEGFYRGAQMKGVVRGARESSRMDGDGSSALPNRRPVYSEQQIGALATPGAGVYQSANRGAPILPMTESKVIPDHRSKHES